MTIYVKKEEEKVYNALMLDNLAVGDMVEAVCYISIFVFYFYTQTISYNDESDFLCLNLILYAWNVGINNSAYLKVLMLVGEGT